MRKFTFFNFIKSLFLYYLILDFRPAVVRLMITSDGAYGGQREHY